MAPKRLKPAVCLQSNNNYEFQWSIVSRYNDNVSKKQSAIFRIWRLVMKSHSPNTDLRNNSKNFHPCICTITCPAILWNLTYTFSVDLLSYLVCERKIKAQMSRFVYTSASRRFSKYPILMYWLYYRLTILTHPPLIVV